MGIKDLFKKSGSWANLTEEEKERAMKDPKIRKKVEDLEKDAEKIKDSLDDLDSWL